ncbi:MAG TPA: class I SAM-dependent methyltransferase, partial [Bacillota bacterium]|nr:class I SAM-dependent methyltransferase [Bacillota bacterium]
MQNQGISNIYEEARIYDIIFGEPVSEQDLEFYRTLINQFGEPVLELACGTGRVTIPLAKMGFQIAGLDLSKAMTHLARQKSQEAALNISFYNADMTDFSIDQRFGFIFIPNQS